MSVKGNTNAKRGTLIRDMYRKIAVQEKESLEKVVKKVFSMAEDGDMAAVREIGDRLDGKSLQSIETSKADPFEGMTYEDIERELWERFGVPSKQAVVSEGERQTH